MNELNVLYEDNHIIVVIKPRNILTQGDNTGDTNMLDLVKEYIKVKYDKPGNVFVGLVHRLDRPVAGVMVFAKTSKAASRLSDVIRRKQFNKRYYAVVQGELDKKSGTLKHYIEKDLKNNRVRISDKPFGAAKDACLNYRVVSSVDGMSLIDVELITGRSHQIRAQFSTIGYPLIGDLKYGWKVNVGKAGDTSPADFYDVSLTGNYDISPALWSYYISFKHPVKDEVMEFKHLPNMDAFPWDKFTSAFVTN